MWIIVLKSTNNWSRQLVKTVSGKRLPQQTLGLSDGNIKQYKVLTITARQPFGVSEQNHWGGDIQFCPDKGMKRNELGQREGYVNVLITEHEQLLK